MRLIIGASFLLLPCKTGETISVNNFSKLVNEGIDTLLYGVFRKESYDVIGFLQIKLPPITDKIDVCERMLIARDNVPNP